MQAAERPEESGNGFWRWIGGLGVVFAVLFAIGVIVIGGNAPDGSTGGAAVVRYFSGQRAMTVADTFVIASAIIVFAFFLTALYRALAGPVGGQSYLALIVIVGGAVYLGGLLFGAVLQLGMLDAATAHQSGAAETLALLDGDDWVPVVTGLAIIGLGTGVAGLRQGRLPWWLAAPSILIGLLAVAGPFGGIAFLATPLWALLFGVALLVRPSLGRRQLASTPAVQAV
jgi:hypothetical protein